MEISLFNIQSENQLFTDLRHLIEDARSRVASTVNAGITMLYWHIGQRINCEILGNQRAEYGKQIVATLARQLKQVYGKGYEEKSLRRMMQFANLFRDPKLCRQCLHNYHGLISWKFCC